MPTSIDIQAPLTSLSPENAKKELSTIIGAAERLKHLVRLERLVIPHNMAETLTKLQPKRFCTATGAEPLIMPIAGATGWILILSPRLFSEAFDAHIRHALYWHELTRLVHKMCFPALLRNQRPSREGVLLSELNRMFGEYDAARKAWQWRDSFVRDALKEQLSPLAQEDFIRSLTMQVNTALALGYEDYPTMLNKALDKTGDSKSFLIAMQPFIVRRSIALALAWAAIDHDPAKGLEQASRLRALPSEARPLLGLFRNRHVSGSFDLREGIPMLDALWQIWGLHLTNGEEGLAAIAVPPPQRFVSPDTNTQ